MSFAVESQGGKYRHWLEDGGENRVGWCMLNPSLAGATVDDPTKNKIMEFSRRFMYDGAAIANVYPYRTPYPKALWAARDAGEDIVGPMNAHYLEALASLPLVVVAWGTEAEPADVARTLEILRRPGRPLWCLGTNKNGSPKHPLYLPFATKLVEYLSS